VLAGLRRRWRRRLRAAIDVGSGSTKLVVAEVDLVEGRVVKEVFVQERPVSFSLDSKRTADGALSAHVQAEGLRVLRHYLQVCKGLGVRSCAAIATEVFRKAPNGRAYLDRIFDELGLVVRLVSQESEADLGFRTGAAFISSAQDRAQLCVWDSGGGSFQVTSPDPVSPGEDFCLRGYLGSLGTGVVAGIAIKDIQGKSPGEKASPNPLPRDQVEMLVVRLKEDLAPVPEWLAHASAITAIGGPNSMFKLCVSISRKNPFSLADVQASLDATQGKEDEELQEWCKNEFPDPPSLVVVKLALLRAVMEHCGMSQVCYQEACGSCLGMLVHPSFRTVEVASVSV